MAFLTKAFDFKKRELLLLFIFIYVAILYVTNSIIMTDGYYHSALGNQLSADRIEKILETRKKYMWILYFSSPILVLLKLYAIAAVIYTGGFFFNLKLSFQNALKIVLLAELVMVAQALSKIIYWLFYPPVTVADLDKFSPLSIVQIVDASRYPSWSFYPLQLVSLFEIAYWVILVLGVAHFTQISFKKSLAFAASSYGIGLTIWILLVVFIQVQFS